MEAIEPCRLFLGTEDGFRVARLDEHGLAVVGRGLDGQSVRAIDVDPDDPRVAYVGCGLRGNGLYRIEGSGETVRTLGFDDEWVWGIARDPTDSNVLYAGTEPPMVHVSTDGGKTFAASDGIDDLPSRSRWTFFHDPFEAGHIHGFAIHPDRPERIFAGVEHGALIYSHDGGDSWNESLVGRDLHRIAIDPTDPDRIFAVTGSGMQRSDDAGAKWEPVADLRGKYLHAIVFDPVDPDRAYVYADDDGDPIHASTDGGASWTSIARGLPAARPADTLGLHPNDPGTLIYVGDSGEGSSHAFVSTEPAEDTSRSRTWTKLDCELPKTWRLAVVPAPERGTGVDASDEADPRDHSNRV